MQDEYLRINGKDIDPKLFKIFFIPFNDHGLKGVECYLNLDLSILLPVDGSSFPIVYRRGASVDQDFKVNTVSTVGRINRYQLVSSGEARSGDFDHALMRTR